MRKEKLVANIGAVHGSIMTFININLFPTNAYDIPFDSDAMPCHTMAYTLCHSATLSLWMAHGKRNGESEGEKRNQFIDENTKHENKLNMINQ